MTKHYLNTFAICLLLSFHVYAQKLSASTDVKLNDFTLPPYAIDVLNVSLNPQGGLRYQTGMPIAGRLAAKTDAAKMRGAEVTPSGTYIYSATTDATGQVQPGQGSVFSLPDPRVKLAADTPADWVVWGTRSADGPLRLPYGGNYGQLVSQVNTTPSKVITLESLVSDGPGLNYDNYALFPRYRTITRSIDPSSGRLTTRVEQVDLQVAANRAKLARYIAVGSDTPEQRGRVIAVAPNRFEGIATRFVKDDKNASARQVNMLTFDDAGNLVKDQPVNFTYNRALTSRVPILDPTGKVVGTFTVFGNGPGKKDAQDPDENRFSVVVTNEEGGIWSQFEWTANGSGNRAVMPNYVLRRGDQLLVYSTNQQKVLKPVEESWVFDRTGKAEQMGTLAYGDIAGRSKEVGTVSNEVRREWFNYTTGQYVDSFTDANGESWVLLQRYANPPVAGTSEVVTPAPATPAVASKLMGFANKLNQMTGQSAPAPASASTRTVAEVNRPNDAFVLHFDKNMMLKKQTVVALQVGFIRLKRMTTPGGIAYLLNDEANTLLSIKNSELTVQRLTPADGAIATPVGMDNFVVDESAAKLYLLYKLPKKVGQGRVVVCDLN